VMNIWSWIAACAAVLLMGLDLAVQDAPAAQATLSPTVVTGEGEKPWWDAILIVENPSPAAFLDMVSNEEYLNVHEHRVAALDRGDLITTSKWTLAD
jgi:hypothetical protein